MNNRQFKDYYKVLGVDSNATGTEIKKAFRKLAMQYHPDRNRGNQNKAEEIFKEINEAYQVLGDKDQRRNYDYIFNSSGYSRRTGNGFVIDRQFVDNLDEEGLRQLMNELAALGFSFRRCSRGYGRRCQRW